MSSTPQNLSFPALASYGFLALPLAFAGMPLYIHAPDFYTTQYGVSLTALGLVLLGLRLFDAVQDPLIGILSDRYAAVRNRIMFWSTAALGTGFLMLFLPPAFSPLLWFAVAMTVATTAFSILSINLTTLGGVWSGASLPLLSRISSVREGFGLIGLLLAAVLPPLLVTEFPAPEAFRFFSYMMLGILIIGFLMFKRWYQKHFTAEEKIKTTVTPIKLLTLFRQQKLFYLIYALSMLASSFPAVLVMFFIRDRLEGETFTGLFLVMYFLSGVLAMPLWRRCAARHGLENAWLIAMGVAIASFVWAYFLRSDDLTGYGIICLTSGMALGAELALPPAILAKKVKAAATESQATTQFSLLMFLSKLALALAAGIALPLMEAVGFHTGEANSEAALQALSFGYALFPSLLKLVAATLLLSHIIQHHGETNDETKPYRSSADGNTDII